jgi:hypothetical protein
MPRGTGRAISAAWLKPRWRSRSLDSGSGTMASACVPMAFFCLLASASAKKLASANRCEYFNA